MGEDEDIVFIFSESRFCPICGAYDECAVIDETPFVVEEFVCAAKNKGDSFLFADF